ncbi:MAG: AlpA family phage regulatory protein [Chlorobiaceae bacterium]|nr:AlpA family phage regulatory protein [Chlorobiaceae bacterium]
MNERPKELMRMRRVLEIVPVSKTVWYRGMQMGRFPKPVPLSEGTVAWRSEDVWDAFDRLYNKQSAKEDES